METAHNWSGHWRGQHEILNNNVLFWQVGRTFALSSVTGLMLCVVMAVQYPILYQQVPAENFVLETIF